GAGPAGGCEGVCLRPASRPRRSAAELAGQSWEWLPCRAYGNLRRRNRHLRLPVRPEPRRRCPSCVRKSTWCVLVAPGPRAGPVSRGSGEGNTAFCAPVTAALQALKRKKRYEKQLSQIDGTLSTIEFQREALENSHTNTEVLKNMGYAAQAMKKVHENMDLNKIDDLMQDITEQQDVAQEISDAISNRAGFRDEFDEDELMAELEELEQEELNKRMRDVRLPSVPSTSLPSRPASTRKRAEDEDEMKKLAAWAS
uniref:Charged multivesicular body protein 4C n=1 Tax=Strigops habroptila TaxID=2489341 RepID=A0A672U2B9_STRHB